MKNANWKKENMKHEKMKQKQKKRKARVSWCESNQRPLTPFPHVIVVHSATEPRLIPGQKRPPGAMFGGLKHLLSFDCHSNSFRFLRRRELVGNQREIATNKAYGMQMSPCYCAWMLDSGTQCAHWMERTLLKRRHNQSVDAIIG
jgi:hypothetical protein